LKLTKKVNHVKAISPGRSPGGGALSIPYVRNAWITGGLDAFFWTIRRGRMPLCSDL